MSVQTASLHGLLGSTAGAPKQNVRSWRSAIDALKCAWQYHQAFLNATNRRRFAITDNDLMALVPKVAEKGDVVACFGAGSTPFLLRPDGDYWRMLGPCYLEDNMDGQALAKQEDEVVSDTVYKIR
jgi:hypothetical protein